MRTLIAGVGYHNLSDLSLGPTLVPRLRQVKWHNGVEVEDLSFGPIAVVQQFQDRPAYFDRVVFISAVERGREPGQVYSYRWPGELPGTDEIQRRVGEAVTGVISLDNLLIIAEHFKVLPRETYVVEVEPVETEAGLELSPRVQAQVAHVIETVKQLVDLESK